jgi:hypothetical protein
MRFKLFYAVFVSFLSIHQVTAQCYTANAGSDVTICSGSGTTIGTSAISGYTYSWSPSTGLNNPNIAQPTASPTSTTTYTLTMTPSGGSNLLTNGSFESGNLTGFSTDYEFVNSGNPPEGQWGVFQSVTTGNCITSPSSGNWLYSGTPADLSAYPIPSQRALYVTVNVSTSTNYTFSGFIASNWNASTVDLEMRLVGNNAGSSSQVFTTSSTCSVWTPFSMNWSSGSNTQVTLEIRSNTDSPASFAIDDLKFNCASTTDLVTVTVSPATPSVTPAGPITYYNHYEHSGSYVISATTASSYQWYKNNVAISGATNQTYSIPISGLGSYTDNYKCITPCGTSNTVTFNYIGCTTNNGYPVSVPTGACISALMNGNYVQLPTVSLGSGTTYSWNLDYHPTYFNINSSGRLTSPIDGAGDANGIISKSTRGTEELFMFYYFAAQAGCHMAAGTGNPPAAGPSKPRWADGITYLTPNPAKYAITIRSKDALSRIEIYSVAGGLLKSYGGNKQSIITLDISELKRGMYIVKMFSASGIETKKLVVQ